MRTTVTTLLIVGVGVVSIGATGSAQATGSAASPGGQRFELSASGIAVTMPAGWHPSQNPDRLPIFEPVLAAAAADGSGQCFIEALRLQGSEANKVAETLGRLVAYPAFEFGITEGLRLPGGDAVLMHADYAPGGQPGASVAYVFTSDDGYAWLSCETTGSPPEDLWLSIAETFEFLPGEG